MRIKLDLHGVAFEYERPRMPERRFRALCLLAAAGIYGGVTVAVAALCGLPGVGLIAVLTLFIAMFATA